MLSGNVSGREQREEEEEQQIVHEIQTRMEEHQRLLRKEAMSLQGQIREVVGMLQAQGLTSLEQGGLAGGLRATGPWHTRTAPSATRQ